MNIIRPMLFSYLSFLVYTINTFIFYEDKKLTFKFRLKKTRRFKSEARKDRSVFEMDNPIDRWPEWDNIER